MSKLDDLEKNLSTQETKIKEYIASGEFLKTRNFYPQLSRKEIEKIIFLIACNSDVPFTAYAYACFLLQEKETDERHLFAGCEVLNILCHINGAYQSCLYHVRRAIELNPDDITTYECLLFLNIAPEYVVSDQEALAVAYKILKVNPKCRVALRPILGDKEYVRRLEAGTLNEVLPALLKDLNE